MDIYSFINSRDIAAYCREINKVWNPFDMAVIIGISNRPVAEKHSAWRELIADYPDMPIPEGGYHCLGYPSLHQKLSEAIAYEEIYNERAFALFKKQEQGAVYTYSINQEAGTERVFSTYELTLAYVKKSFARDEIRNITIRKSYLDDGDNDKGKLTAHLDCDGNLDYIVTEASDATHAEWFPNVNEEASRMFSDNFYVIIPTPFKRGDILTYRNAPSAQRCKEDLIFVLDYIDYENPKTMERRLRYDGDITDMAAIGYYMADSVVLTQDHIIGYDKCEYYSGSLEDKNSLLQYVSWYLQGKITLPALLTMQSRIMLQHILADVELAYPEEHIIAEGQADHQKHERM